MRVARKRAPAPQAELFPELSIDVFNAMNMDERVRALASGTDREARLGSLLEEAITYGEEKAQEDMDDEAEAVRATCTKTLQSIADIVHYMILTPADKKADRAHVLEVMGNLHDVVKIIASRSDYLACLSFEEGCEELDIGFPIN